MRKERFILPVIAMVFCCNLYAQGISYMCSLSPVLAVPIGEFKEAVSNDSEGLGIGGNFNFLVSPKGKKAYSPVWFGVDYNYIFFGRDKQNARNGLPPYKTSFNYHLINGIGRVFLTDKEEGFTPFIDGMMGLKIYNTTTKVDKDWFSSVVLDEDDVVINTTNDSGLGYGIGMGFFKRKITDGEEKVSFTLRVLYMWGDKTKYVKRGSLKVTNDSITYDTDYTNTNVLLIQFGINIFN